MKTTPNRNGGYHQRRGGYSRRAGERPGDTKPNPEDKADTYEGGLMESVNRACHAFLMDRDPAYRAGRLKSQRIRPS